MNNETQETRDTSDAESGANGAQHAEESANGAPHAEVIANGTQNAEADANEVPDARAKEQPRAQEVSDGLRLRMKVWTDPTTKKRYLAPTAALDKVRGIMTVHAVSEEGVKKLQLNPVEWNALPFYYFVESGPV